MKKKLVGCIGLLSTLAVIQGSAAHAEQWGETEKLQDFVSRMDVLTNADTIDKDPRKLSESTLPNRPWSSTFWPDLMGSVAWRYTQYATNTANYNLDMLWGWSRTRGQIMGNNDVMADSKGKHKDIKSMSDSALNDLSPAEKYDLLMGDANYTFWNKVIARVDQLASKDVNLMNTWSGVCHGWSPASLTMDRPLHGVKMMTPFGKEITFYPDDIKALAAFLWGTGFGNEGNPQNYVKIEGWECQTGAKNNSSGRLLDPRCQDVNPAFFHLAMINQIGINHRGFVMDRNFRAEVQNQPTFAYRYKYFNVASHSQTPGVSLADAKVPFDKFQDKDTFKNFRAHKTAWLVGVEAQVWYGKENYNPDHTWKDDPSRDATDSLTIRYDLELDEKNEIIGGEWREYNGAPTLFEQFSYQHPDIMWLAPIGLKAMSPGDFDITSTWDGTSAPPKDWSAAAIKSANKHYADTVNGKAIDRISPQPLAKVVDVLIAKSRKAE